MCFVLQYGKQLRENYRAFKNKQVDSINPKEYNSYTVPNVSCVIHFFSCYLLVNIIPKGNSNTRYYSVKN